VKDANEVQYQLLALGQFTFVHSASAPFTNLLITGEE
jgi:hypothetical protein